MEGSKPPPKEKMPSLRHTGWQAAASERVAELQAKEQARMDEFKKRMGLS